MKPIDYSNLAVFGSIGTIVLLAGVAVLMKWVSSQVAVRKHADSLTPADLRVLESSAERMIDEIKETAAVACRDIDDRCEDLRKLILIADQKITLWAQLTQEPQIAVRAGKSIAAANEHPEPVQVAEVSPEMDTQSRIYQMADAGMSAADIAREMEMPMGEISLMLSLRPARV